MGGGVQDGALAFQVSTHVGFDVTRDRSCRHQFFCGKCTFGIAFPPEAFTIGVGELVVEWIVVLGTLAAGVFKEHLRQHFKNPTLDKVAHPRDVIGSRVGGVAMDQILQNEVCAPIVGPLTSGKSRYYKMSESVCDLDNVALACSGRISLVLAVPSVLACHKVVSLGSGMSRCPILFVDLVKSLVKIRWVNRSGEPLTWNSHDLSRPAWVATGDIIVQIGGCTQFFLVAKARASCVFHVPPDPCLFDVVLGVARGGGHFGNSDWAIDLFKHAEAEVRRIGVHVDDPKAYWSRTMLAVAVQLWSKSA